MSDTLRFFTYDVFTEVPYAGNPLAIVEAADGLSDGAMQTIAREFNLSETIFVRRPSNPSHTASVRIFFPTAEIPFAGHPTVGCAIHLALKSAPQGDFETQILLEEVAGLVPVQVWRRNGRVAAEFVAPVLPHPADEGTVPEAKAIATALGISPEQIEFDGHRPGVWQGGPRFLYVPVADLNTLAQAGPREPAWSQMMETACVDSAYLYCPAPDCSYRARMFSPTAGIPEDPATGSASAILAAQLLAAQALHGETTRLVLHQGVEMGRASEIGMTISARDGALQEVRVSGSAVPISQGEVFPPKS